MDPIMMICITVWVVSSVAAVVVIIKSGNDGGK
jgi:hypothetical protein